METAERGTYPIQPNDIDAQRHFFGAFGHYETEASAAWVVRFCQSREAWQPFTLAEINEFYHAQGRPEEFWFNRLVSGRWVVQAEDDRYHVTPRFIEACHEASPAGRSQ